MYKGKTIDGVGYKNDSRTISFPGISAGYEQHSLKDLESGKYRALVYVSHAGIYVGDIYEFNGSQYLATWDLKKKTVTGSGWDWFWGTSDTDDPSDVAVTNKTYRICRKKTGKGGDFMAITPIKLVPMPMLIPVPK